MCVRCPEMSLGRGNRVSKINKAEEILLEQIRRGDQAAWSQLVDRFRGRLLSFARTKLGGRGDAEDVVQDTFVAFLTGLERFRAEAGLETYLFTILRRKVINRYRSAHARHVCLLQDICEGTGRPSGDSDAFSAVPSDEMTAIDALRDNNVRVVDPEVRRPVWDVG